MKMILATTCLILAILCALGTISLITSEPAAAVFGAVCTVVFAWLWHKLRKSKQAKSAKDSKPSATQYRHIQIRVAGVTYDNDDGTSRQQLLRKIKFGDTPFEDNDNLDVQLDSYRYKGEPAVRVLVSGCQIGNVPKEQVAEVQRAMAQQGAQITAFDVVGGGKVDGERLSYGARIVLRYNA